MLTAILLEKVPPEPGFIDSFVFCAPILRGFEGFLKRLMQDSAIPLTRRYKGQRIGVGGFFESIGKKKTRYRLDKGKLPSELDIPPNRDIIMSECYGIWGSQRNKYFHEPDNPIAADINISHGNAVKLNNKLLAKIRQSFEQWNIP